MTRMSVAELTLKKQIDRIERDMNTATREIAAFNLQYNILLHQRDALEIEKSRLATARHEASTKRKPSP